jgi:hypothetical protein
MEHSADTRPLTTVQQCGVNALAAGSTFTAAAATNGMHRVTVYRWMKTASPSPLPSTISAAAPWKPSSPSMPEPAPDPDGEKLLDSAIKRTM